MILKDNYIKELEDDVTYLQHQLDCTAQLREKEKTSLQLELQQVKNELSETKKNLEKSKNLSNDLQCEITAIKGSAVWKVAKHFYKGSSLT